MAKMNRSGEIVLMTINTNMRFVKQQVFCIWCNDFQWFYILGTSEVTYSYCTCCGIDRENGVTINVSGELNE